MDNVQPGVEKLLDAPDDRTDVSLVLGVSDADAESVHQAVEQTGATVEESLFYDNLVVGIDPDTDLRRLCRLDSVSTVEVEGTWEQMDEGNSDTQGTTP